MNLLSRILLVLWLASLSPFGVASQSEVDRIIALPKPPPGVVFEVVSGAEALNWAVPEVKRQAERLRTRFPDLPIVLLSHGSEQFALTTENAGRFANVHEGVRQIRKDGVNVQVCGTHAGWRGVDRGDFPKYVDVVPAATAAINDYREIGYHVVILKRPAN